MDFRKQLVEAGKRSNSEIRSRRYARLGERTREQAKLEKAREARYAAIPVVRRKEACASRRSFRPGCGGKDGTIRHVMSGLNPQGCRSHRSSSPPPKKRRTIFSGASTRPCRSIGEIGIFNRSHYEDVLVVRVHDLVPKEIWSKRYDEINYFEKMLPQKSRHNREILPAHQQGGAEEAISRAHRRSGQALEDIRGGFRERKYWDDYTKAYEDALARCSTDRAPWYVIPANKKWFRNLAVSRIIVETLEDLKMKFPPPSVDIKKLKWK